MKKIIIILVCLILGFLLYTFVVALYKANFNVDGALPEKNTSKDKVIIENAIITETDKNTEPKTIIENGVVVETNNLTNGNSQYVCNKKCQDDIEIKKVEIYLGQNLNKLVPKNPYVNTVWGLQSYTVDTKANIGIVIYGDGKTKENKDFLYYQDTFGDITHMILR